MSDHVYSCRVRWSDVDVYGHVNNVKYFEYVQEARVSFMHELAEIPFGGSLPWVIARQDVEYKRPMLFRSEPYDIHSTVTRIGTSSYDLTADIMDGETLLARARTAETPSRSSPTRANVSSSAGPSRGSSSRRPSSST